MSVLVFAETEEQQIKKSSLEAISYGAALAEKLGGQATAFVVGELEASAKEAAGNAGAAKIMQATDEKLGEILPEPYTRALEQAMEQIGAKALVFSKSSTSDAVGPRVAARLGAAAVSEVVELPETAEGFQVKRSIFSGKAFEVAQINADRYVLTLKKNAFGVREMGQTAEVEAFSPSFEEQDFRVKITNTEKTTGEILLPEAEIVVSGGRGLKGPENWGLIEDLAKALGAATGCSKPVADSDWRPHHEHVGQTGVKISPALYIAVGISGAIQHVAGVNSSQVIVVINKDPEAPFFKVADYGIVGDAFEVVPKLTEAIQNN